jgi:RNA polymerase sigma-70 factor (ECF subfamily)
MQLSNDANETNGADDAHELVFASVAYREETALATLYDRHASRLYGLALLITHDDRLAQDVVEHVFVDIWHHTAARELARSSGDRTLLRGILLRALAVSEQAYQLNDSWAGASACRCALCASVAVTRPIAQRALVHLPRQQQVVLALVGIGGFSVRESAALLGQAPGEVERAVGDAMRHVRATVAPD